MCEKITKLGATICKVLDYKEIVVGETNTRRVLIDPVLCSLGYDTSNPYEVINEYTCDFGVKKGEKVDYALFKDAELTILVEAKSVEVELGMEHISQLYRYFSVTNAQVGVLTNGLEYWFFTDTKDKNKMDDKPFFKLNIETIGEGDLDKLLLFHKDDYNIELVKSIFGNLAIRDDVKTFFLNQVNDLDTDLLNLVDEKLGIGVNKDDLSKIIRNQLLVLFNNQTNNSVKPNTVIKDNKINTLSTNCVSNNANTVATKESNSGGKIKLKEITSMICTGSKVDALEVDGVLYEVKSWSDAIYKLVNHIAISNSSVEWLDGLDGTLSENKGFIRKNGDKFLKCMPVGNTGLFLDVHGSSYMHIQRMKVICRNARLSLDTVNLWLY